MKTYTLAPNGASKIAASLCKICSPGQPGESLIRDGFNQSTFTAFLANISMRHFAKGRNEAQLAQLFTQVSAANASAARQALGGATLVADGGKAQSVEAHWGKAGGAAIAVDTSLLDLGDDADAPSAPGA